MTNYPDYVALAEMHGARFLRSPSFIGMPYWTVQDTHGKLDGHRWSFLYSAAREYCRTFGLKVPECIRPNDTLFRVFVTPKHESRHGFSYLIEASDKAAAIHHAKRQAHLDSICQPWIANSGPLDFTAVPFTRQA